MKSKEPTRGTMQDFFDAIQAGDLPKVQGLFNENLKLADSKNSQGLSAVMWARYNDQQEILKFLLRAKEQPPTIFEAAATGNHKTTHFLDQLDKGLVNSYSVDGFTPLQLASFFGTSKMVKQLLTLGANVKAVSKHPYHLTALHSAVGNRDKEEGVEIAKALLIMGADPNAQQAGGITPLHAAAAKGSWELALLLLIFKADKTLRDNDGKTPREVAESKGQTAIVALFDQPVPSK
jgi:uncharacterized protein